MTTESGIPDPEPLPPRPPRFTGPLFFPITAAISFVGTLSATGTALAPEGSLPDFFTPWVTVVSGILFLLALFTSGIAVLELLSSGMTKVGSMTVAGRRLPEALVGGFFLLVYLLPWIPLGIKLVFLGSR